MDNNRKTAYATLVGVEIKKQYSNLALNAQIKKYNPENQAFVRELVYGVLENKILLDYVISKCIKGKIKNVRTPDLIILRMGIYQIANMSSVPTYAAVSESVNLAKKYARGREKFINAVLRKYIAEQNNILLPEKEDGIVKYLSTKYSYASWIVELWLEMYDAEFVEELVKAGNLTPTTTIRVNTLKTDKEHLKAKLKKQGFEVADGISSDRALNVKGTNLLQTVEYKEGFFSVQDEASQIAIELLSPQEKDVVIDVCAAPGGKSFMTAEIMNNKGEIYSMDIYTNKISKMRDEIDRLGIENIRLATWDATNFKKEFENTATKIIVDVPCSALGIIRRKPEVKYKKRSEELLNLPTKQLQILEQSAKYLRDGGIILYTTCSINHYENQRVVNDFVRKHQEFSILKSVQLLPNVNNVDGFYICLLKKER